MKVAGRFDPIPNIRAAGKVIAMGNEGAYQALNTITNGQPGTPEHIRKYRKSFQNQPGLKQVHPGQMEDGIPVDENHRFGKKTLGSDGVQDVIKAQNLKGLADKFNEIKEEKYASRVKEPLAKGYERGYNWPEAVHDKFSFGAATISSENAK